MIKKGDMALDIAGLSKLAEARVLTSKELATLADCWVRTNAQRLALDKESAVLKADEELAKATLIAQFQKQGITGIGGTTVRVAMNPEPDYVPAIKDWTKYYAYIYKNKAWELLERRPGRAACKERWEQGVSIPGCDKFPVFKLTKQGV